jgi:putative glutamine amidotransferase
VIPNSVDVDYYFEKFPIEAIVLTGGNMLNPKLFGGKISKDPDFSDARDETEKRLLEIAIKKRLPVLGICRGMQFINVFFKGRLVVIKDEVKDHLEHVRSEHPIDILDDRLKKVLGNKIEVNSYHNFGVIESVLSKELKVVAESSDGVIEAIYHKKYPIMGIEWHPERKSPDDKSNKKIIEAFFNKELFWKR